MMRAGYNPVRRNRNIGTTRQGHGRDNRLYLPADRDGLHFVERIGPHERIEQVIAGKRVTFIVEKLREGWVHPCSIADVVHLMSLIPTSDWAGLALFVFRQPTRKQQIVNPAWGRLLYNAELKSRAGRILGSGAAIFLEAIENHSRTIWSSALDPDDQRELERLAQDGHVVERKGRRRIVHVTAATARNTQLYRTLLHETGHWFDWLSKVEEKAMRGGNYSILIDRYFARPTEEREAFAHRFADETARSLTERRLIPFDRLT